MTPAATEMKRAIAHRYRHNRNTKLVVLPIGGKAAGIADMKWTVLFRWDTRYKKPNDSIQRVNVPLFCTLLI